MPHGVGWCGGGVVRGWKWCRGGCRTGRIARGTGAVAWEDWRMDITRAVVDEGAGDADVVALLLHGYGADEHDLVGLAQALPTGTSWAALRAPLDMPGGGAAWYEIRPGSPTEEELASATSAVRSWVEAHLAPTAAIVPIGFSQGGLMASQLLRTAPQRVPAIAILGGFVAAQPQTEDDALAATRPPVFWGRGGADAIIPAALVERTASWLAGHSTVTERVYEGLGHGIAPAEVADLQRFLASALAR